MPKLNCHNWECGVVVPVTMPVSSIPEDSGSGSVSLANKEGKAPAHLPNMDMDIFQGIVPVAMRFPGAEYGMKRPWFYREKR
jgi:hypothetical protein